VILIRFLLFRDQLPPLRLFHTNSECRRKRAVAPPTQGQSQGRSDKPNQWRNWICCAILTKKPPRAGHGGSYPIVA